MTHPKLFHFTRIFFTAIFASQTDFLVSSSSLGSDDKVISTDQVVLTDNNQFDNLIRPIPIRCTQPKPELTYEERRLRDHEQNQEKIVFYTRYKEVDNEEKVIYLKRAERRIREQTEAHIRAICLETMVEHEDLCTERFIFQSYSNLTKLDELTVIKAQEYDMVIRPLTSFNSRPQKEILKDNYAIYFDGTKYLPYRLRSTIEHRKMKSEKLSANKKQSTPSSLSLTAIIASMSGLSPLSSCYQMSSLRSTSKPTPPPVNLPTTPFNIRRPK